MVDQAIKELSALYKEMSKRFNNIKTDYIDDECILEKEVLTDMQTYFAEVLEIIPRSMNVYYEERLKVQFLKNEFYNTEDGKSGQTDAAIITDRDVYKDNMVFSKENVGKKFCGMDSTAEELNLSTFEYMCSVWNDLKREIHYQIIEDLEDRIKRKLKRIKKKKEHMENLKNWNV